MADTAEQSWQLAERRCFEFLLDLLSSKEGKNGFIGRFPPGEYDCWHFAITGGPPPIQAIEVQPSQRPGASWRMNAELRGRYADRATAQAIAGKLRNAMPAREVDGLTDIQTFRWTGEPTLSEEVFRPANKQKDVLAWQLDYPLEVVFNNATE